MNTLRHADSLFIRMRSTIGVPIQVYLAQVYRLVLNWFVVNLADALTLAEDLHWIAMPAF